MNKTISLFVGAALVSMSAVVVAEQELTEEQMDSVTAGYISPYARDINRYLRIVGDYNYGSQYSSLLSRYISILGNTPSYGTPAFGAPAGYYGYRGVDISSTMLSPRKFYRHD